MLQLIKGLSKKFQPRIYIIADTDILSEDKIKSFNESISNEVSSLLFGLK